MFDTVSLESLESLAKKFKTWRGNRRHVRYPESFWKAIRELSSKHSIQEIAKTIGVNAGYLRQRLSKDQESMNFAQVNVVSFPSDVAVEFVSANGQPVKVSFQADFEQLRRFIQNLQERSL